MSLFFLKNNSYCGKPVLYQVEIPKYLTAIQITSLAGFHEARSLHTDMCLSSVSWVRGAMVHTKIIIAEYRVNYYIARGEGVKSRIATGQFRRMRVK